VAATLLHARNLCAGSSPRRRTKFTFYNFAPQLNVPHSSLAKFAYICIETVNSKFCIVANTRYTPISSGCFSGTSRIFSNAAANRRRVAAGDYGYNIGNTLFSSPVQVVFPA
jgi:hypothetical protein